MISSRTALLAFLSSASFLAITSAATAQTVLFSTGVTPSGDKPAVGPLDGPLDVRGGITQVRTDDGGMLSFVGDARFTVEGSTVRVSEGKLTSRAGTGPMRIIGADGTTATLAPGAAASIGVSTTGMSGRALSGMVAVATASGGRQFAVGNAFTANAAGASGVVTAGVQPTTASMPRGVAGTVVQNENPLLPVYSGGSRADVLAQALGNRDTPLGFDFEAVSRATADVNLAFLRAGGAPGGFSAGLAGTTLQQYLAAVRAGLAPTASTALADAYLGYFDTDGLSGITAAQKAIIEAYTLVLAAGGSASGFNDATVGTAYSDYIRQVANEAVETGLSPAAIAAYENYIRSLGLGETFDAGRRAQIEAFQKLQAAGGSTSATVGADVIDRYLAYLATGGNAADYVGASTSLIATYLDYLRAVGIPEGLDPDAVARLLAFYEHLAAGGGIDTLPDGPVVTPLPTASYAGALYGFSGGETFSTDPGRNVVRIDDAGYPRVFNGTTHIGTARFVEAAHGDGWIIGRYTDGTVQSVFSSGTTEQTLSANDSLHFGYATSALPVTRTSGTARYALAATTTPSYFDGSVVTAAELNAQVAITFGSDIKYGISGDLATTVSGTAQRYAFESEGGLANPSIAAQRTNDLLYLTGGSTRITTTDARCNDGCYLVPNLIGSGANSEVLSGTYAFYSERIHGLMLNAAAIFTPASPPDTPPTSTTYAGAFLGRAGGTSFGGDAGPVAVQIDQAGYPRTFYGRESIGTARLVDAAKGEGWVLGRYTDGTVNRTTQGTTSESTLSPNESIHFAFGTSYVPFTGNRGTARYDIAGFTTPTYADGSVVTDATLTGAMVVQFGSQMKYGMQGSLTTTAAGQAQRYDFASAGGLTDLSLTGFVQTNGFYTFGQAVVTTTDARCASGCRFSPNMYGSGADGQIVAGTYSLAGTTAVLSGAAVFTQTSRDGTPVAPPVTPVASGAPTGSVEFAGIGAFTELNGTSVQTPAVAMADGRLESIRGQVRGTNTDHEFGGLAGAIGWTRWSGGTTDAQIPGRSTASIAEDGGQHMVWGKQLTNAPSAGTATYALAGMTKPTIDNGSIAPGILKSGTLAVDFGTMRVGYDLSVQFGGTTYGYASRGGSAAPGVALTTGGRFLSSFRDSEGPLVTGNGCTGTNCYAETFGFVAGDGGSHAGLTYHFLSGPGGSIVNGAAVFAKAP